MADKSEIVFFPRLNDFGGLFKNPNNNCEKILYFCNYVLK